MAGRAPARRLSAPRSEKGDIAWFVSHPGYPSSSASGTTAPPRTRRWSPDTIRIGTSGWQYRHWRGRFYPDRTPIREWLPFYAESFETVEVNNAFYRLPEVGTFEQWRDAVPDDFEFAVKASRYLTHIRRLREPEEPVQRLMERAEVLGRKLGPVLLQLAPNHKIDLDAIDSTLRAFPRSVRVTVEPRHSSWWTDGFRRVLEQHRAALCWADRDGRGPPHWQTADWGYVRLHHGRAQPESCYGRTALQRWAGLLADAWPASAEVYVYFNNDGSGCAPRNAAQLGRRLRALGPNVTRTPRPACTPV